MKHTHYTCDKCGKDIKEAGQNSDEVLGQKGEFGRVVEKHPFTEKVNGGTLRVSLRIQRAGEGWIDADICPDCQLEAAQAMLQQIGKRSFAAFAVLLNPLHCDNVHVFPQPSGTRVVVKNEDEERPLLEIYPRTVGMEVWKANCI